MRQTAKYTEGCRVARKEEGIVTAGMPHDDLYKVLEAAAWAWSSKNGKWEKQARPVTSSMFGDDSAGSGVFRARLMAHPKEIDSFVADTVRQFQDLGYAIDEVSGHYPNRRGVGTRVYVTMTKAAR